MSAAKKTICTVIPNLHYRDAPAAIEWLCRAFGFEKRAVYADDHGRIMHSQLTFGNGMVMVSSANDNDWGRRMAMPADIGGRETQCSCVIVANADTHHAQAVAAGATILDALKDNDYGGRGYSCSDPEGHIWWFGTYDPWDDAAG